MTTTASSKQKIRILDLVLTALGAVLITVCSWISIPAAVPFSMQTFAIFLVLLLLGGKRGTGSLLLYILLGAFGLPVFSGFTAGPGRLLGVTGGYIVGFLLIGLVYWLLTSVIGNKTWVMIVSLCLGLVLLYLFGTLWYVLVYSRQTGNVGILSVLSTCVFPFVLPDLLKMGLAFLLANRLLPVLAKIHLFSDR